MRSSPSLATSCSGERPAHSTLSDCTVLMLRSARRSSGRAGTSSRMRCDGLPIR